MRWISAIVAVAVGAAAYRYAPDPTITRGFLSAVAGIAATLLGFIVAALSILTAVLNRRLIINLRKTGHYDDLVSELFHAAVAFLVAMISALVSMLIPDAFLPVMIGIVASCSSYALAIFSIAGKKFGLVIKFLQ